MGDCKAYPIPLPFKQHPRLLQHLCVDFTLAHARFERRGIGVDLGV